MQDNATTGEPTSTAALPFWVTPTADDLMGEDDSMGMLRGDAALRLVPLGPLRRNLAATVQALQKIFEEVAAVGGTLELDEAQLSFEVTASGGIQLIGTGNMKGTRGLTLTFKRP